MANWKKSVDPAAMAAMALTSWAKTSSPGSCCSSRKGTVRASKSLGTSWHTLNEGWHKFTAAEEVMISSWAIPNDQDAKSRSTKPTCSSPHASFQSFMFYLPRDSPGRLLTVTAVPAQNRRLVCTDPFYWNISSSLQEDEKNWLRSLGIDGECRIPWTHQDQLVPKWCYLSRLRLLLWVKLSMPRWSLAVVSQHIRRPPSLGSLLKWNGN